MSDHRIIRVFILFIVISCIGAILPMSINAQQSNPCDGSQNVYLMSYFTSPQESLHLAYSCDGYAWEAINNNAPILESAVGTGSMRDPFILPAPDGTFHLIWTNGWNSDHIGYAHSTDLVNWGEQRLLPLMADVEHTRNMWAPEIFFDPQTEEFRLLWSSTVFENSLERFLNAYNHRIWTATTQDFETFSPSEIFFDPGYSVIDATLVYDNDRYTMIYKDERGNNQQGTDNKAMRVTSAPAASGPYEELSDLVTPHLTEGPTVFKTGDQWIMFYDHFMDGHFGASASDDLQIWNPITDQVTFPPDPRHATVFTVPYAIFENLVQTFS